MVVKFYEWNPNGSALGHASLTLKDGTHISWWPDAENRSFFTKLLGINGFKGVAKSVGLSAFKMSTILLSAPASVTYPFKPYCMSSWEDDYMVEGRDADRVVTLRNCLFEHDKIMSWWNQAKQNENYILLTNNCATMVMKALKAGGTGDFVEIPEDYYMWTPYRVFEYCQQLSNLRLEFAQE